IVLPLELRQFGGERVAGAAVGIAEHNENALAAKRLDRYGCSVEVWKLEGRGGRPGSDPVSLDPALGQRALPRQPCATRSEVSGKLQHLLAAVRQRARDPSARVDEVADRRAHAPKCIKWLRAFLEQNRAVKAMLI